MVQFVAKAHGTLCGEFWYGLVDFLQKLRCAALAMLLTLSKLGINKITFSQKDLHG